MRLPLILAATALALALALAAWLATESGWLGAPPPPPAPEDAAEPSSTRLPPAEEEAILLEGVETVGFGETRNGVTVRRDGDAVVFEMGTGALRRIEPPEGATIPERFVILTARSGGFFLEPAQDGRPVYFSFADAGGRLEPPTAGETAELYRSTAARIAEAGALPFLSGTLEVVSATPRPEAVIYCLQRDDGLRLEGGTRFVGPLSITVLTVGLCRQDSTLIEAYLDLGEAALANNR
jgi:hypothetical protein